jgi:transposase InsO family protein
MAMASCGDGLRHGRASVAALAVDGSTSCCAGRDGRRIRCLAIVDDFSKESVAIEVDTSLSGSRMARVLDPLAKQRGLPPVIPVDNGPEFTSLARDD